MRLPPQTQRGGQDAKPPNNPTPIIKSPDLGKTQRTSQNLSAKITTPAPAGCGSAHQNLLTASIAVIEASGCVSSQTLGMQ
jgi:hypothetical protein